MAWISKEVDELYGRWEDLQENGFDPADLVHDLFAHITELQDRIDAFENIAFKADLRERYPDLMATASPRDKDDG